MVDVSKLLITKDYIKKVHDNVLWNEKIVNFYKRLAFEEGGRERLKYFNKGERIGSCNNKWDSIHYEKFDIKDFQKTWLCDDYKFCNNCKKIIQACRSLKYEKELEKYDGSLYHCTFTIASCTGEDLRNTIANMESAFKKFINYLRCYKKIKGLSDGVGFKKINLESFNYKGCLRSLEVTWFYDFKTKQYMYHPHFHCAFVFDKNDIGEDFVFKDKNIKLDPFSFKRNDTKIYPFNVQEELFQRLWYLCYNSVTNDIEINLNHIENIRHIRRKLNDPIMSKYKNVGYSCKIVQFAKGEYAELFKYMIKSTDFDKNPIVYQVFKDLLRGLHRVQQLQGYGCFYGVNDDVEEMKEVVEDIYLSVIQELKNECDGVHVSENICDVVKSKSVYISKKKIYSYIVKEHKAEIKKANKEGKKVYKLGDKEFKTQAEMFTFANSLYKEFLAEKNNLPKDTNSTQKQITYL